MQLTGHSWPKSDVRRLSQGIDRRADLLGMRVSRRVTATSTTSTPTSEAWRLANLNHARPPAGLPVIRQLALALGASD